MGAEWWLHRRHTAIVDETPIATANPDEQSNDIHGVVKARASTNNVCPRMISIIVLAYHF
jgi:hypothetical protein